MSLPAFLSSVSTPMSRLIPYQEFVATSHSSDMRQSTGWSPWSKPTNEEHQTEFKPFCWKGNGLMAIASPEGVSRSGFRTNRFADEIVSHRSLLTSSLYPFSSSTESMISFLFR